jgi:hypothetical protein
MESIISWKNFYTLTLDHRLSPLRDKAIAVEFESTFGVLLYVHSKDVKSHLHKWFRSDYEVHSLSNRKGLSSSICPLVGALGRKARFGSNVFR